MDVGTSRPGDDIDNLILIWKRKEEGAKPLSYQPTYFTYEPIQASYGNGRILGALCNFPTREIDRIAA